MKDQRLRSTGVKYSIAVLALLAAPCYYAQKRPANDTLTRQKDIEEVVMIGYGTAKKGDLTGSVATIKGADIAKVPVSNVAEALTGKIAGVKITNTEGSPDSEVSIRVRGGGSLTQDSSPLIIVDGFPVNSMSDIAPSDIENMTVLKDASSTAIYGSRGAYGVILITTKSGKSGKLNVTFNTYSGFKQKAGRIDVLSPQDYLKWQYEYAALDGSPDKYKQYFGEYSDMGKYADVTPIDWQDEIYGRTGTVLSNDISARGGNEKASFNINLARYDEKSIMLGSDLKRENFSVNLKSKPLDKLDLSVTFRHSNTEINGGGTNEQNEVSSADSRLKNAVLYTPFYVPGLTTVDPDDSEDDFLTNPYTSVTDNDRKQERRNYNIQGSIGYKIIKNLQFKSDVGVDFIRYKDYRFYGRSTYYVRNVPVADLQGDPALIMMNREDRKFRNSNTLNYDLKDFLGDEHRLKLLVGEEMLINKRTTLSNVIHGFPSFYTFQNAMDITTLGIPQTVENFSLPDDKLLSFFGRVNYDFRNRYLFTATLRADGSSKFLGDNKWGYFPSMALAWKINEESFLKNASWIDLLKLRISYGEAGNNNIPTGQQVQSFVNSTTGWINNVTNYWSASKILANPDLKWETMVTQNIGLDFDFFKGRLTGSVEAYKNLTTDLLLLFPLPGSGYDGQYQNFGENENKGVETTLSFDAIRKPDFNLNLGLNISFNKNKLNNLGTLDKFRFSSTWIPAIDAEYPLNLGQSIGQIYGYVNAGRYEVSDFNYNATTGVYTLKDGVPGSSVAGTPTPGSLKLKDINGDGKVDLDDRTIIGNANPKFTGGFNIASTFKNFDFSAAFNFTYGNDIYNANKIENTSAAPSAPNGQFRNLSSEMADGLRWTNIDPNTGAIVRDPTALAALNANTTMWSPFMQRFVLSDWAIEDGSFLRLNNVTLGYTLPKNFTNQIGLSKLRVYATANNVFVLTNYSGMDPEVDTRRKTPLTPGVDYSPYPKSRMYVMGLNVNF
ncbi:TonB-dependent receptor [Chryseobacterium sp. H3056]|uniref:TonB-dependent receptor n=1 Tax=Kaistella daneshvariae TaxID=2487074 RepID=A0A3N0WWA7_9FLAO|nr:TonB-dependent receptor [Kaistella daneshvariae]ROI09031.1 TonB-dependent receptor [Kaistella daneshvariae]